jgi:hypothetical protein
MAWGIAIAVVATIQLTFALTIDHPYDRRAALAFLAGPLYPLGYWALAASAALRAETVAAIKGPRDKRVVWHIEREVTAATAATGVTAAPPAAPETG